MNRTIQPNVYVVLAWLMVATLAGCVLAPPREVPAQMGRVLDDETQQPIEGAIVVLNWQGIGTKGLVDAETVCYHVESAVTDANGRYTTVPWKEESRYKNLSMKQIVVTTYRIGYRKVRSDMAASKQYLRRDTASVKDRLAYLLEVSNHRCFSEEQKNLIPLNEAISRESALIASTNEEKALSRRIQFYLDVLKVGWDEAFRRKN